MNTREQAIKILRECVPTTDMRSDAAVIVDALIAANVIPSVSHATAWDEGAIWGFDERGPVDGTHLQLVPEDNPYRSPATTKGNTDELSD